MLQLLKKSTISSDQILSYQEHTLIILTSLEQTKEIALETFSGYVITDTTEALEIIQYIRLLEDLSLALKPLLFHSNHNTSIEKEVEIHCDGHISQESLPTQINRIKTITKRVSQIHSNTPNRTENYTEFISKRYLGYLFSRENTLPPLPSRKGTFGYIFPLISLFFNHQETLKLFTFLEELHQKGYVSRTLHDTLHLCKNCHGNYFNFRECCPSCSSFDIETQDIVHHFVCAHVAPISDFQKENQEGLHCPKCDKTLRHIGIDYDKPSSIHCCNSCQHEFQNPNMKAFCFDCNTSNELHELLPQKIHTHQLTQKGIQWIQFSDKQPNTTISNSITNAKENVSDIQSLYFFELLLKQEINRLHTTTQSSMYAQIHLKASFFSGLNTLVKKAFHQELLEIMQQYLTKSDVLASQQLTQYHVLLPRTTPKELERLECIAYNIEKLIRDNFSDDTLKLETKIHLLSHTDCAKELMLC